MSKNTNGRLIPVSAKVRFADNQEFASYMYRCDFRAKVVPT